MIRARVKPGDVVAGRFEILAQAGAGGMGVVFRARDVESSDVVALKVMRDRHSEIEVARFAREARLLAESKDAAVVRYIAHGVDASGAPWLAMEWLDGSTLTEVLAARGSLTIEEVISLGRRVAAALGAIHARGIVHRDVKPSNLFLVGGRLESVRLLDFGIARMGVASELTRTGGTIGTVGYAAPEQARGDKELDARADIFALGCIMYRALVGRPPFEGAALAEVLAKTLFEDPPPPIDLVPRVPREVSELVMRSLAKQPSGRPASARDVEDVLARIAREVGEASTQGEPTIAMPPRADALGDAEQRLVTVVFVSANDLKTAPIGSASDLSTGSARSLATSHGADVEALADGSLVAIWSGRGEAMDQAQRAARTALALRTELPDRSIAIATGRGLVGRARPVGEAIDRAAALARTKGEPCVRVDEVAASLLEAGFVVSPDARLVAERPHDASPRLLLGRPAPYVGRDRELASLVALFEECADDRVARAALVTGAAGLGKSRLRHELVARLREHSPELAVWTARGDVMRAGTPFGMLAQLVAAGLAGDAEHAPRSLRASWVNARSGGAAAARLAELASKGREPSPELAGQIVDAFTEHVREACENKPVALVLEDLHVCDLPTVRAVDALLRDLRELPIFVLGLARPVVKSAFPDLWAARGLLEIALSPLSRRAGEAFVRELLGRDVDAKRIVERSEGNPLHLEELVRVAASGRAADAPGTVIAILQARLDDLDAEARRCLRAASVFGYRFTEAGLAALVGTTSRPIAAHLADLDRSELVHRDRDLGEGAWIFRHDLARDAVYATFTDDDRALGHRLAAAWLETTGTAAPIVLAEHHEAGGDHAQAAVRFVEAADQALRGSDVDRAVALADRAVACGAAGEVFGEARLVGARAAVWRGDLAEATRLARAAVVALPAGDKRWSNAARMLAVHSGGRGDIAGLVSGAELLLETPPRDDALPAYVESCMRTTLLLHYVGRYALADALVDGIDERLRGATSPELRALLIVAHGPRAQLEQDWEGFENNLLEAVRILEATGDIGQAPYVRVSAIHARLECGVFDGAEELRRIALRAKATRSMAVQAWATGILSYTLYRTGSTEEAAALLAEGVALFDATGERRLNGILRGVRARMLLEVGRHDEAESEARGAVASLARFPPGRATALASLSRVLLEGGRIDEARDAARDAHEILARLGRIGWAETYVRLAHAETLHASGAHEAARTALREARDIVISAAGRMSTAEVARSYRENVPENARILALSREWLTDAR
jgi:serine/threonine protein kinase/tetratricopeptide (TPR) repeat protein